MSQTVQINIITGTEAVQSIKNLFLKAVSDQREECRSIMDYFEAAGAGLRMCSYDVQVNYGSAVAASGTIAFSSYSTANDTVLVNGVTLTAVSGTPTNNQFKVEGSAGAQAIELARAINASTTALVSGATIASVSSDTVTITAAQAVGGVVTALPGELGNAVTIAKGTDAGTVMTVSGARLTGGTNPAANVYHLGQ